MSTARRRNRSDAGRRTFGGRTLVALFATAALIFGPGAMSAFADDSVPVDPAATTEVALAAPAADPVLEPPAPEPPAPPAPEAPAELPAAPEVPAAPEPPAAPEAPADGVDDAALPDGEPSETAEPADEADPPAAAAAMVAPSGDEEEEFEDIDICHATGAVNHWVMVPASASGDVNGHAGSDHQDGRDIIPPFEYSHDGTIVEFPGQNWDAEGQAIYYNDCEMLPPPPPPNPVVMVTVDQCVDPEGEVPSTVGISISSLVEGFDYVLEVTGPGGFESETPLTPVGGGAFVNQLINGPGDYLATVTGYPWMDLKSAVASVIPVPPTVSGSQEFTVDECPPPPPPNPVVDVTVVQCLVHDGDVPSTVTVTITNLVEGLEYALVVTGPDGFMSETPVVPVDGSAVIEQPVPGPGDYVATVTGTWWTMEYPVDMARVMSEEGEWEEHTVTGMQAFTVNDCPPPPPPPASVTPPLPITSSPPPIKALAVTGAATDGSDVGTALFLLLGAGAALLATGARRGVRSRL
ncbi:hypothetical protein ACSHWG_11530 [Leucobacter sp. Z1108]|uniref:hypothetical protein n=1 Tax=Leucobacter sp. Z1108 TaxID=3439066 RepID=UPI003F2BC4E5